MTKKKERWKNVGTMPLRGDVAKAKTVYPNEEVRTEDYSDWPSAREYFLGLSVIERM